MSVSSPSAITGQALGRTRVFHVREWVAAAAALALAGVLLYLAGFEQGAVALFEGTTIHEFVHDARHALGFPCH
ncbi:CbtB-domain containing protein [Tepidiforma sp.]|jgi:cobalt transporter subunit CbtB|uniref:CbtB domain-containing protein n=1 Tax=Tepidiforma sp. TaxID=2682230 RepID=UPI0021DE9216|nr:CbtB-domain containing protein [Tepidiforma sp.]MCX7616342.1 CbtB-domain containing protein [Tepidiforma sp.]GIW17830.1 MAG: hypothetical protein KatS3mg064_0987 [Tepidiforma sp.]